MIPVILSGGSGTRLWPVSRKTHPKQFWPLLSESSMLQQTYERLQDYAGLEAPIIVCNHEHRFFVAHQMEALQVDHRIILEPCGRNTAPATAVAALNAIERYGSEAILLILPADHQIENQTAFYQALQQAEGLAQQGYLVTFGIVPQAPETGYGYIQAGPALETGYRIQRFVEKPDRKTAQAYLDSGQYYWNSGMFLMQAERFLEELKAYAPEMEQAARRAYEQAQVDMDFIRLDQAAFSACPSDSIDYAVMEHTQKGAMVPLDAGWNDVGSWSALWQISPKDENDNVKIGDVVVLDSQGCFIRSDGRLLAGIGLKDLIIVDTPDVTLVLPRSEAQRVKDIVQHLSEEQRQEIDIHALVHRPWGCYQGIDRAERYQVKRISVKPGASLSLQMHHHRAEHWIVVRGTARVTRGDETFLLTENESTYIPIGVKHRLENPGVIPLDIIEVQSGSYLGEDDIVRFEDIYGRSCE